MISHDISNYRSQQTGTDKKMKGESTCSVMIKVQVERTREGKQVLTKTYTRDTLTESHKPFEFQDDFCKMSPHIQE